MTRTAFSTRLMLFFTLSASVSAPAFELMSYNVENLFDTEHDAGKIDYEYLAIGNPLKEKGCKETSAPGRLRGCLTTDWTPSRLELKLNQINRIVHEGLGHLPGIMTLAEVENEAVVAKLAQKLGFDGYKATNGPDERGIDVAVMYDSKQGIVLKHFEEHQLMGPIFEENPTRNILEAHFATPKGDLILFVNHWPSQNNPVEHRIKAAEKLRELMEKRKEEFKHALVVASGDFNTIDSDKPHPFSDELLSRGDIKDIFMNSDKEDINPDYQNIPAPKGTFYYRKNKEWNFLDRFFVVQKTDSLGLKIKVGSQKILAPFFAIKVIGGPSDHNGGELLGIPWAYNHNADHPELAGFSDHFPIVITLE